MGLQPEPPVDFLLTCSELSLSDFELSRLNRAANLRKQARELHMQLLAAEAEAVFARWLIVHCGTLVALGRTGALQKSLDFVGVAVVEGAIVLGAQKRRVTDPLD